MAASWTTTYTGLVSLLQTYVEDTSTEFTNNVQGIINRAEERVIRDVDVALFDTTETSSTVSAQAYVNRPSSNDPGSIRWIRINSVLQKRRTYEYLLEYGGSGQPIYFHETDDYIYLAPTPDQTYTVQIRYLNRPTPLSASNTLPDRTRACSRIRGSICLGHGSAALDPSRQRGPPISTTGACRSSRANEVMRDGFLCIELSKAGAYGHGREHVRLGHQDQYEPSDA